MKDVSTEDLKIILDWAVSSEAPLTPVHIALYNEIRDEYDRRIEQQALSFDEGCEGGACKL